MKNIFREFGIGFETETGSINSFISRVCIGEKYFSAEIFVDFLPLIYANKSRLPL